MRHKDYNMDLLHDPETPTDPTDRQHHGDLRKAAYLKRRAAYQMQAQLGTSQPIMPGARKR